MERSKSAPIDRVLDAVKALIAAVKAVNEAAKRPEALDAVAWANLGDIFQEARRDFDDKRGTMEALAVDLDNRGYEDPDFSFEEWSGGRTLVHAAGIRALYFAVSKHSFQLTGKSGAGPLWLECARSLEKALSKALKWLKVREAAARKRRERPGIALTAKDEAILRALAKDAPTTMTQEDLADVTRLSVRTVRARLKFT